MRKAQCRGQVKNRTELNGGQLVASGNVDQDTGFEPTRLSSKTNAHLFRDDAGLRLRFPNFRRTEVAMGKRKLRVP